jgi:mannose-6-phosphate isomerase-like protein (cupin superfamily)
MSTGEFNNTSKERYSGSARVLGPRDGETLGTPGVMHDRFMISGEDSGGGFALVEHLLPPRALAAPLHRHTREDEYSYVLEGRVGALLGEEEVFGEVDDLIFKPRGQWHTFWNAGDVPARILEIISPGGFEEAFREIDAFGEEITLETMAQIANRYGVDADFRGTSPIIERHGLTFF